MLSKSLQPEMKTVPGPKKKHGNPGTPFLREKKGLGQNWRPRKAYIMSPQQRKRLFERNKAPAKELEATKSVKYAREIKRNPFGEEKRRVQQNWRPRQAYKIKKPENNHSK